MSKKNFLVICISILVIILSGSVIFAWLLDSDSGNIEFEQPNYRDFEYNITFNGTNEEVVLNENGLLEVIGNLKEPGETGKYIENLTASISFIPEVAAYLRMKINDSWELTRTYASGRVSVEIIYKETKNNFVLADDWYYDENTNYIYYQKYILKSTEKVLIPFIVAGVGIDTGDSIRYTDDYRVIVDFVCDVVQANRFQEIWGIDAIPNGGDSIE